MIAEGAGTEAGLTLEDFLRQMKRDIVVDGATCPSRRQAAMTGEASLVVEASYIELAEVILKGLSARYRGFIAGEICSPGRA